MIYTIDPGTTVYCPDCRQSVKVIEANYGDDGRGCDVIGVALECCDRDPRDCAAEAPEDEGPELENGFGHGGGGHHADERMYQEVD